MSVIMCYHFQILKFIGLSHRVDLCFPFIEAHLQGYFFISVVSSQMSIRRVQFALQSIEYIGFHQIGKYFLMKSRNRLNSWGKINFRKSLLDNALKRQWRRFTTLGRYSGAKSLQKDMQNRHSVLMFSFICYQSRTQKTF